MNRPLVRRRARRQVGILRRALAAGVAGGLAVALAAPAPAAVVAGGLAVALAASAPAAVAAASARRRQPVPPPSERTLEVLRVDCANHLGRREVTLFGNGTIRVRDGPLGKEWMGLAELGPDELQGVMRRLAAEDLADADHLPAGPGGDWVEKCAMTLELPGQRRQRFSYGRYDALPLSLSHVQAIAAELGAKVPGLHSTEQLPERYEPRIGDVVKRTDGTLYRIVNFTSDKKGVELDGLEQPIHLLVLKEQLRLEFVALMSRER